MPPKVNRIGSQADYPVNPENPPQVLEGEPRVDLGEEEMDASTLRNIMAAMQVEMNNLRSEHNGISQTVLLQQHEIERQRQEMISQQADVLRRQTEAATAMETALRLARESRETPPQQNAPLNSTPSAVGERPPRPRGAGTGTTRRPEVPPERPAESAHREERSQREEQPARNPR